MTQQSFKPFSLKIMLGNPNFKNIVKESQELGCQQDMAIPWTAPSKGEKPRPYIQRILTNNTCSNDEITVVYIVTCGQRILPIPESLEARTHLLKLLSGRRHQIWMGLACQINSKVRMKLVITRICFKHLTLQEIKEYSSGSEGQNYCGGYHPSGVAARFIKSINGSSSALTGLPAFEFHSLMTTWRAQGHG